MLGFGRDWRDLALGRGVHLGSLTAVLAGRHPDRVAVVDPDPSPGLDHRPARTFADAEEAVARFAAAALALGVRDGERVLVAVDNRIDVLWLTLALARLGAVPVPINARLRPPEVAGIVVATGAGRIVADPDVRDRLADAVAGAMADSAGDVQDGPTGVGAPAWIPTWDPGDPTAGIAGWLVGHADRVAAVDRPLDATAVLLCTSGTTGLPKAAALTSEGLLGVTGRLVALPLGVGPRRHRDRTYAALPLAHVMGLAVALGCLSAGVPMLRHARFEAEAVLDTIECERPNVFVGVPTMYADLEAAGAGERDLSSVQLWASGADAMPAERARRFQRHGALATPLGRRVAQAVFADGYGMVELSGLAAVRVYPSSLLRRVALPAMALVLPGIEVRTVDEDGEVVGRGQVGRLQFRGDGVLRAYEGRPDAGPDEDGWFDTGDHARLWAAGGFGAALFQLAGRTRDRLKVGGFSVFPAEVEESLAGHPDVREVALVGLEDERLGERPVALVVLRTGAELDREAWLEWARSEVAGYRRPHEVHAVEALPRGGNAKLDRDAATALAKQLAGRASVDTDTASTPADR